MPIAILYSLALCMIVYPLLSIILWLRGIVTIPHYAKQMCSKKSDWERMQVDRGEGEEWYIARAYAIRKNDRYRKETVYSSENEFNVNMFLKTTTGMNLEDLRSAGGHDQFDKHNTLHANKEG